jgi:hypothetical protein
MYVFSINHVPTVQKMHWNHTTSIPKDLSVEDVTLNLFGVGNDVCFHFVDEHLWTCNGGPASSLQKPHSKETCFPLSHNIEAVRQAGMCVTLLLSVNSCGIH